jgi:hypothetical protein
MNAICLAKRSYVVPVTALANWIISRAAGRLPASAPLMWCICACTYLLYVLARGQTIGTDPYAFIDATDLGYPRTMANCVGLLAMFVLPGFVVLGIARMSSPDRSGS